MNLDLKLKCEFIYIVCIVFIHIQIYLCVFFFIFLLGYTIDKCRELYMSLKNRVFVGRKPYDSEAIEGCLKKYFGDSTTMDQLKHPK